MEAGLHVTNLPLDVDEDSAVRLLAEYGEIRQLQLVGSGACFVRYAKRPEALAAMSALNGHTAVPNALGPLRVKFAEHGPDESAPSGGGAPANGGSAAVGGDGGGAAPMGPPPYSAMPPPGMPPGAAPPGAVPSSAPAGGGSAAGAHKLFVGMIPYSTGEAELQHLFSQFGPLMEVGPGRAHTESYARLPACARPCACLHACAEPAATDGLIVAARVVRGGLMLSRLSRCGRVAASPPRRRALLSMCARAWSARQVFMMREKDGRSKGCAFVRYYSREAAMAACHALNGTMALTGAARNLVVKYAHSSSQPRLPLPPPPWLPCAPPPCPLTRRAPSPSLPPRPSDSSPHGLLPTCVSSSDVAGMRTPRSRAQPAAQRQRRRGRCVSPVVCRRRVPATVWSIRQ